jgi:cyclase
MLKPDLRPSERNSRVFPLLAKRIIPCLDVKAGRVVKGTSFVKLRDAGDPVQCAKAYDKQGADELVFLDIGASHEERNIMIRTVEKVASSIFIPLTVGGGIRTLADIRRLLLAGADKVSLNTAALDDPTLIKRASQKFGSQCIVVAIDCKREPGKNKWTVYTHGGRRKTKWDTVKWAKYVESLGAGEILLTSMNQDGQKTGYDLEITKTLSNTLSIPVIASGGAGSPKHLRDALKKTNCDAVLAASIFHFKQYAIPAVKRYLKRQGIAVRL